MSLELVIFDCDGVLVDSEPVASRVASAALGELGWAISPAECFRLFTGMTLRDALPLVQARVGTVPDGWLDQLAERFMLAMSTEAEPVPGARETLLATDRRGLAWCVASNSSRREMAAKFAVTGLAGLVGARIHAAADVGRGKPAPDLFLAAAAANAVPPERCLVVEDSVPGVSAAAAAGMVCVGLARHDDGAALAGLGARVIHDLGELAGLLDVAMRHGPRHLRRDQ